MGCRNCSGCGCSSCGRGRKGPTGPTGPAASSGVGAEGETTIVGSDGNQLSPEQIAPISQVFAPGSVGTQFFPSAAAMGGTYARMISNDSINPLTFSIVGTQDSVLLAPSARAILKFSPSGVTNYSFAPLAQAVRLTFRGQSFASTPVPEPSYLTLNGNTQIPPFSAPPLDYLIIDSFFLNHIETYTVGSVNAGTTLTLRLLKNGAPVPGAFVAYTGPVVPAGSAVRFPMTAFLPGDTYAVTATSQGVGTPIVGIGVIASYNSLLTGDPTGPIGP